MRRCDWCQQEELVSLVPVVNRNPTIHSETEYVCRACSDVERFEHADELLWNPVTFESLRNGRVLSHWAA
jgi:hypothetical protein